MTIYGERLRQIFEPSQLPHQQDEIGILVAGAAKLLAKTAAPIEGPSSHDYGTGRAKWMKLKQFFERWISTGVGSAGFPMVVDVHIAGEDHGGVRIRVERGDRFAQLAG